MPGRSQRGGRRVEVGEQAFGFLGRATGRRRRDFGLLARPALEFGGASLDDRHRAPQRRLGTFAGRAFGVQLGPQRRDVGRCFGTFAGLSFGRQRRSQRRGLGDRLLPRGLSARGCLARRSEFCAR